MRGKTFGTPHRKELENWCIQALKNQIDPYLIALFCQNYFAKSLSFMLGLDFSTKESFSYV